MNDKITVIIPVYNTERTLERCVDSVIKQTFLNLEILLVDDGSTDRSGQICDEYLKKDSRIKVFHKKNGGAASARNLGIDCAKGEYISFVDSDDWLDLDLYEKLINEIDHADFLIYKLRKQKKYQEQMTTRTGDKSGECLISEENEKIFNELLFSSELGYQCNKLVKRKKIGNKRIPEIRISEDLCFNLSLLSKGDTIKYTNICGYNYFWREDSALHHANEKNVEDIERYEKCIWKYLEKINMNQGNKNYSFLVSNYIYDIIIRDIFQNKGLTELEKKKLLVRIMKNDNIWRKISIQKCPNKIFRLIAIFKKCKLYNMAYGVLFLIYSKLGRNNKEERLV